MMNRLALLLLMILAGAFRVSNPGAMTFDETKHNFGFIHQGEIVFYDFTFTNTGDKPIIIEGAEVTCRCTTVDYPREPIGKGQKGTIRVTFDSKSAMDRQERSVVLKSNATNSPVTLSFKCVVLKPKN